jgi:hypothetical protein
VGVLYKTRVASSRALRGITSEPRLAILPAHTNVPTDFIMLLLLPATTLLLVPTTVFVSHLIAHKQQMG